MNEFEHNELNDKSVNTKMFCKDCVLCIKEIGKQTSCELDRIHKFVKLGKANFDKNSGFYEIDTVCNTFRKQLDDESNETSQDVLNQVAIQCDFIVPFYNENDKEDFFEHRLNEIHKQAPLPRNLIVIGKAKLDYVKIYNELQAKCSIPFNIVRVINEEYPQHYLDMGIRKCSSTFYSILEPVFVIPEDFMFKLNHLLNYDLKQFVVIKKESINCGTTILTKMHELLKGYKGGRILDKIECLAKEQNLENMVINYESIQI